MLSTNSDPVPFQLYITPETEDAGIPNLKFTRSTSISLPSTTRTHMPPVLPETCPEKSATRPVSRSKRCKSSPSTMVLSAKVSAVAREYAFGKNAI